MLIKTDPIWDVDMKIYFTGENYPNVEKFIRDIYGDEAFEYFKEFKMGVTYINGKDITGIVERFSDGTAKKNYNQGLVLTLNNIIGIEADGSHGAKSRFEIGKEEINALSYLDFKLNGGKIEDPNSGEGIELKYLRIGYQIIHDL